MTFECTARTQGMIKHWEGKIANFKKHWNCYEIKIESRSVILVIFGETTRGKFACMPDFKVGCHLGDLYDIFWNTEQLAVVLDKIDAITVASALYALADSITF